MNWIKAAFQTLWEAVAGTAKRAALYFIECCRRATKRPLLVPVAGLAAVGITLLSPIFAASLVAILINDPLGHPLVRMGLDAAGVAVAIVLVLLVPWLGIPLAALPLADLSNRFIDQVKNKVKQMEAKEAVACGAELACTP